MNKMSKREYLIELRRKYFKSKKSTKTQIDTIFNVRTEVVYRFFFIFH